MIERRFEIGQIILNIVGIFVFIEKNPDFFAYNFHFFDKNGDAIGI